MNDKNMPRLIIAAGDDSLTIESTLENYTAAIEKKHGHYTVDHFDSSSESIGEFTMRAMTVSMFQEIRLFCILHAQNLPERDLKILDEFIEQEIPDVYVFISVDAEKKNTARAKLEKTLQLKKRAGDKSISVIEATKPYDNKLADWIMARANDRFKRRISKPDAQLIADSVEYSLIDSELKKIDMALPPGAPIDRKTIQEVVGATRAINVYELAGALGKRDLPAALCAVDSLFASEFYAPLVASTAFRHFWSVLKIRKYLEKNPDTMRQYNRGGFGKDSPQSAAAFEIGKACGLLGEKDSAKVYPVIIKPGIISQSQAFSSTGLKNILRMLQQFDVGVKTGRADAGRYTMQMLCYKIVMEK
ncbi:MAG: hypothetical protein LBU70_04765 [Chitinispirillales bacterium]|jgi:DNA polymerase III delta subunit|nr:hypothetical protein [Chitinispirillales bacterium]